MKTSPLTLFLAAALAAPACAADALPPADGPPPALPGDPAPAPRFKLAVLETTATVDGSARPDLGRSFSDTIVGALLRSGAYELIEPGAAAPGVSVVQQAAGADAAIVPTLIGQGDFYKLTIRRLALPSGKVEDIVEESATGTGAGIFQIAARAVPKLLPQARTAAAPSPVAPAPQPPPGASEGFKIWMAGAAEDNELATVPKALPARPVVKPPVKVAATKTAKDGVTIRGFIDPPVRPLVPRPHEIDQVGTIAVVNGTWSFCVIRPADGQSLRRGDQVLLKVEGWDRPTVPAIVTRLENGLAVAEFGAVEGRPPIETGTPVYQWLPISPTNMTTLPPVPKIIEAPVQF